MRLSIDTIAKTLKLENDINLGEFIEKIQTFLPDWKEYKLITNCTINWYNTPTIVPDIDPYPLQPYWNYPTTICSSAGNHDTVFCSNANLKYDCFNVELK
jgi:hypothetical protein